MLWGKSKVNSAQLELGLRLAKTRPSSRLRSSDNDTIREDVKKNAKHRTLAEQGGGFWPKR